VYEWLQAEPRVKDDRNGSGNESRSRSSAGGSKLDPGPLTFPIPAHVSSTPQILPLQSLISSKLSTYIGRGIDRAQDYADVVTLIKVNQLPRDYGVNVKVRELYQKLWTSLIPKPSEKCGARRSTCY